MIKKLYFIYIFLVIQNGFIFLSTIKNIYYNKEIEIIGYGIERNN